MQASWFVPVPRRWPWQNWYNYNRVMASTWIRCLQLIPYLESIGIHSKINSWNRNTKIAVFLRRWERADLELLLKLKQQGVKIILDTPVNFFSEQDIPPFQGSILRKFLSFASEADVVICPSPYIEQFGKKKGYNTICLEDSIDLKHFSKRKKIWEGKSLIWSGVSVKAGCLNFLAPVIERHGWSLIIISDKKPQLDFNFRYIKWDYFRFPSDIIRGDIGIFPRVVDNEYDSGHSFFKIGVFLAQHVPVVCSWLPSYRQVITSSNGIGLDNAEALQWEEHIRSILSGDLSFDFEYNPVTEYSTDKVAERYKGLFEKLVS